MAWWDRVSSLKWGQSSTCFPLAPFSGKTGPLEAEEAHSQSWLQVEMASRATENMPVSVLAILGER